MGNNEETRPFLRLDDLTASATEAPNALDEALALRELERFRAIARRKHARRARGVLARRAAFLTWLREVDRGRHPGPFEGYDEAKALACLRRTTGLAAAAAKLTGGSATQFEDAQREMSRRPRNRSR